ncbi:MAG: substrate-binding domain-containing protein [Clostridia bacterium]
MEKKKLNYIIVIIIIYFILVCLFNAIANNVNLEDIMEETTSDTFKIISSTENKDIEETLKKYAKENQIDLQIDYAGTIEIMDKLNNGEKYDAVWCSNSIWLYMLNDKISVKNSKSTSINPVVFGIEKIKSTRTWIYRQRSVYKRYIKCSKGKQTKI